MMKAGGRAFSFTAEARRYCRNAGLAVDQRQTGAQEIL